MPTRHDPLQFITGFGAKLATRSRHVCAFLGAGAGRACGLPDVSQLQASILERLDGDDKAALASQLEGRNLEQALSRLRRIAALLTSNQTVDGLTTAQARALDNVVCHHIVGALDISGADLTPVYNLAAWAGRADYHLPVELFTVNYDLLLETALERLGVPYFDGFVGNLKARFRTELVEAAPTDVESWVPAFFVRLWKLHGSVNWAWEGDQQIVRLGQPITKDRAAAIYPSDTKYEESRRVPFIVLQDRLRRAMHQPETLVVISGYSFSDADLNELIFDAATRRPRSEFVTFCYSQIPNVLADRASRTPNLQVISGPEAILGGIRGDWKPPDNAPPDLWDQDQLALRDFGTLATYLARSVTRDPEGEAILREWLTQASPKPDANAAATGNA